MTEAVTQGFELTLDDGSVVKAANVEEGLKIVAKMKTDTAAALKDERTRREALEQRIAGIEAKAAEAARPKIADGQFNKDEYYKRLNDDPISAQNYLDSYRFGIADPNAVPTTFQQMQRDITVTRQEALGAQFVSRHPEFSQKPEETKALVSNFNALISQGYPSTLETLNIAYGNAVDIGIIKPLEQKDPKEEIQPNPSMNGAGASGVTDAELSKVENMSDKELEALLKSKGLL